MTSSASIAMKAPASPANGWLTLLWKAGIPFAIVVGIWALPVPAGLKPEAWHMFAIFAATICAILTQPLSSGAVMILGLSVAIFTQTLTEAKALAGFASGTVWLIFCAYVLSLGFVKSGLGKRIAYKMLSKFGGSSLGIAYSLGVTGLIMAPAMPSVTARSGGLGESLSEPDLVTLSTGLQQDTCAAPADHRAWSRLQTHNFLTTIRQHDDKPNLPSR